MKKIWPSLLLISLAFVSQPALAEWEYTRWGMSPEALKQASDGAAIPVSGQGQQLTSDLQGKTLLKSTWTLDQYDFDVYFNFSGTEPALTEVVLIPRGNNQNLVSALSQKYGPPTTGVGSLRIQQRRPDFSLIPTNPADRVAPTPTGELSAVVQWQTPTNLIELNRNNPEQVTVRFLPNK